MWRKPPSPINTDPTQAMKTLIREDVLPIIESVLSLKLKTPVLFVTVFGGFTIGAFTGFVNDWIYDPATSYITLIGLIGCDHLTGMYLAWTGKRFQTKKAMRIGWTLVAHTVLLTSATHLSRDDEFFSWINEGVFVPLCLVNFISLVKNLALLGWIKKDFIKYFYNRIDAYKNEFEIRRDNDSDRSGI